MKTRNLIVGLALGCVISFPVAAATNWSLTSASVELAGSAGNTRSYSADGISLTASAWSNTGAEGALKAAYLDVWGGSGLGVWNGEEPDSNPQHSMDNKNHVDSILLNFGSDLIALESLKLGWAPWDSDVSVLAFTGGGTPTSNLGGSTYGSMISSGGWSLVGNYANIGTSVAKVNPGKVQSSLWLVSAYNPQFGGGNKLGGGDDYMKLAMVGGTKITAETTPNPVPEPGSLALLGLGLLGLMSVRRRLS